MIRQYVMTSTLKHWRKIYYSSVLNIQEAMPLSGPMSRFSTS